MTTHRAAAVLVLGFCLSASAALAEEGAAGALEAAGRGNQEDDYRRPLPAWLDLTFEIRGRTELRGSGGFIAGNTTGFELTRVRLTAKVEARPWLRFMGEFQDSRAPGWNGANAPGGVVNTADLHLVYAELGGAGTTPWTLRIGRQPLRFGDTHLIGTLNWGNVGPAYDGAVLTYDTGRIRCDALATTAVRPIDGHVDGFSTDRKLYGLYTSLRASDKWTLEPYWLAKHNSRPVTTVRGSGAVDVHATGFRATRTPVEGWDKETEVVLQRGSFGGLPVRAWAAHAEVGYRVRPAAEVHSIRLFAQYDYATGDGDPNDNRSGTFQHYYPANKWGNMDGMGWKNVHEPLVGLTWRTSRRAKLLVQGRDLWLAKRSDGLYSFLGAEVARNPSARSNHVGAEIDAHWILDWSRRFSLQSGYARLFRGGYLKDTRPNAQVNMGYIMWAFRI